MGEETDETTPCCRSGHWPSALAWPSKGSSSIEKAGILRAPTRTTGRHRLYSRADLKRLSFIRRARQLGFSLDDVRALLGLSDNTGERSCADAHRLGAKHLEEVRDKISDLKKIEKALRRMVASCAEGTLPECPLIETLSGD
jgi:MerR family transcriptional regulator, mercuric resistance operon regulatory protein